MKKNIRRYNSGELMPGTQIIYPFGRMRIVVTLRSDDWHATIKGRKAWGAGKSVTDAVGDLVLHHQELFTIKPKRKRKK